MKIKQIIIIITLFFFSFKYIYGQNQKLDSLWIEYNKAMHDTSRIKLLNEEIGPVYKNYDPDSALICYKKAITVAKDADPTQTDSTFSLLKSNSILYIGIICHFKGAYDKAVEYYIQALKIRRKLGNKAGIAKCYNNIGVVHWRQGSYDKAVKYYNQALKIYEELDDKIGMSGSYNNIGVIFNNMKNYDKAVEYFLKALKIHKETDDKRGISRCYLNIGLAYKNRGNYNTAIEYYQKSLKIDKELCDKYGMTIVFSNIASLHITLYDSAAYLRTKERTACLDSAIIYSDKAYNLAVEIGYVRMQNEAAYNLQKAYTKLGRYKKAIKYAEIFITTKDSMFSEEKTKALAEMETKYESEKKQLMIEKMEKQKESDSKTILAQKAENKKQQIIIISIIGGLIMALVFLIILSRMYQQKQKINYLLAVQNIEINKQKEEIQTQNDFTEKQKQIIEQQNKELENKVEERTRKLIEALKKEKELGDLKSQFVSMASHEFRTPLAAISFSAGFIKKYWGRIDDKKRKQKIEKIETQVKHMTDLLDDVLLYGMAERRKIKINPEKINITEFLNLLIEEVQNVTKDTHKIKFDFDHKICYIMIDEKVAGNIFTNLLINAIKFSPDAGHIDLKIRYSDSVIIIEVIDYGIGINPKELEHIFTPFHRGKNVKTIQGTGLGLAIVKESVDLMKGSITVESKIGEGTKFTITLPKTI